VSQEAIVFYTEATIAVAVPANRAFAADAAAQERMHDLACPVREQFLRINPLDRTS